MRKLFAVLTLLASALSIANAQQGRGTISGIVTDPSGAAVKAAKITVRQVETNSTVVTQSNGEGYYLTPPLNVGNYEISAQASGFKKEIRSGITLQVDQQAEINLQLQVGAATESVQVVGEAPLVNTENASIGQVIENKRVEDLPLNGRNAFALVQLLAGRPLQRRSESERIRRPRHQPQRLEHQRRTERREPLAGRRHGGAEQLLSRSQRRSGGGRRAGVQGAIRFHVGGIRLHSRRRDQRGDQGRHQSVSTAPPTSFCATTIWMRATLSPRCARFRYNQYGAAVGGPVSIPKLYNGKNRTFFFVNWEQYNYVTYSSSLTSTPPAGAADRRFLPPLQRDRTADPDLRSRHHRGESQRLGLHPHAVSGQHHSARAAWIRWRRR